MANDSFISATKAWISSVKQHIESLDRAIKYDGEEIEHLQKMICLRREQIAHFEAGIKEAESDLQKVDNGDQESNTVS